MPLGEEYGGATYFLLETHYDNPSMHQDVIDNSGNHHTQCGKKKKNTLALKIFCEINLPIYKCDFTKILAKESNR